MDAYFLSSSDSGGFSCLKGVLDKNIESILSPLVKGNRGRIGKRILAGFTKATLLGARKKIFDIAVNRETERRSIAKDIGDADANDPPGRAAVLSLPPETWRLVDRRSKPKTVEDILILILHMKGLRDSFPSSVLKKPAEEKKACVTSTTTPPENDWAADSSEEEIEESDSDSESEPGDPDPISDVKRKLENLVRSKVSCIDIASTLPAHDLPRTRTFATQTDDYEQREGDPVCEAKSKQPTPEHVESCNSDKVGTESVSSLLDYIDEEFEAVKKAGYEMNSKKQPSITPSECSRRLCDMERRYESVAKRLGNLEKTHENDIREVKAEITEIKGGTAAAKSPNIMCDRRSPGYPYRAERRHSDSDITSPINSCETYPRASRVTSVVEDDSAWDVDDCDVFVSTQDSQGNLVNTKATPFHLKEKGLVKQPCQCACADPTQGSNSVTNTGSGKIGASKPRNMRKTATRKGEDFPVIAEAKPSSAGIKAGGKPTYRQTYRGDDQRPSTSTDQPRDQRKTRVRTEDASMKPNSKQTAQKEGDNDNSKRRKIDTTAAGNGDGAKTRTKEQIISVEPDGKSPNVSSCSNSESGNESNESYADKVTKYEWKTATGNKGNEKGKKGSYPAIKSAATARNKEMYVRGMSCSDFRVYRDLEEAVKLYCREREVVTIYQRVIMYNKENDSVGIKVVIRETDVAKFSAKGFWPEGISVREWSDEKPTARDRFFGNERSSSDETY